MLYQGGATLPHFFLANLLDKKGGKVA